MNKAILGLASLLLASTAYAHSGVMNKTVMARMEAMKAMGDQTKVIGEMAKGNTPFDAAMVQAALEKIAVLAEETPSRFQANEQDPKSEALPVIWSDFETFTALSQDLSKTAIALSVKDPSDLKTALGALGAACKACHSKFRK